MESFSSISIGIDDGDTKKKVEQCKVNIGFIINDCEHCEFVGLKISKKSILISILFLQ